MYRFGETKLNPNTNADEASNCSSIDNLTGLLILLVQKIMPKVTASILTNHERSQSCSLGFSILIRKF